MVILNRSLRAVFKKESWMFCAGLPLSIADLLGFCDVQRQLAPSADSGQAQTNSMFLADFPPEEHGGTTLPPRRPFLRTCVAWQVAVSTIRCLLALFNPEPVEASTFLSQRQGIPIPSLVALVYNPRVGDSPLRRAPHL